MGQTRDIRDNNGSKNADEAMDAGRQQSEGAKHKGSPQKMGNHQEGQYDKQDDDATMRPSKAEEQAGDE